MSKLEDQDENRDEKEAEFKQRMKELLKKYQINNIALEAEV